MWISVTEKYALYDEITLPHQFAHCVRSLVAASAAAFSLNFRSNRYFYALGLYIIVCV